MNEKKQKYPAALQAARVAPGNTTKVKKVSNNNKTSGLTEVASNKTACGGESNE